VRSLFVAFFVLAALVIVLTVVLFTVVFANGIGQWCRNNKAPVQTMPAMVVAKRGHTGGGVGDTAAYTSYFATFEVYGGDRIELPVPAPMFGQLAERDTGQLTHQGTRFLNFARNRPPR